MSFLLILLALLLSASLADEVKMEDRLGGLPRTGHIAAFGHFYQPGSRMLDVFVIDESRTQVHVYRWNKRNKTYERGVATAIIEGDSNWAIDNVIALDFNRDGLLDVWVQSRRRTDDDQTTRHELFLGTSGGFLEPSTCSIPNSKGLLTAIDFDGSLNVDMIGLDESGAQTSIWRAKHSAGKEVTGYELLKEGLPPFCKLSLPHSVIFADFNADGRADLLLTCEGEERSFEIWTAQGKGYNLVGRWNLPPGAGQLSVGDVDGDGVLDLVYPVCSKEGSCSLHLLHGKTSRPYCKTLLSESWCKSRDQLFTSPESVAFSPPIILELGEIAQTRAFLMQDPVRKTPVSLHLGDYDLDGYPDILAIVADSPQDLNSARPVLLRNVPLNENSQQRIFKLQAEGPKLPRTPFPIQLGLANLGHRDGIPDIIVNAYSDRYGSGQSLSILETRSYYGDHFFIRAEAMVPIGVAKYGVLHPGVTFKFSFTDFDETHRVRQGTQMPQTCYSSIQDPRCLFGLGRTNNFIDALGVAYPTDSSYWHRFTGVLPNSDILATLPSAKDPIWRLRLLLNPSEYTIWVACSILIAITVLGLLTAVFKWAEWREDEAEKRRQMAAINFEAL